MLVIGMMLLSVVFCFVAEHFPELIVIGLVYGMSQTVLGGGYNVN